VALYVDINLIVNVTLWRKSHVYSALPVFRRPLRRGDRVLQKGDRRRSRDADALEGLTRQVDVHSCLKIGDTNVMASDGRNSGQPKFDGFALSLDVKTDAEAQTRFNALSDGGEVAMPLGPTFFATSFGMVKDRFGVHWMVLKAK
jgi:PhnB protein